MAKPLPAVDYATHVKSMMIAKIYFQENARTGEPADYIKQRQLNAATCRTFGVGFAPDRWQGLVDHYTTKTMRDTASQAGLIGFTKTNRMYDFFRHRLMFPVFGESGDILGYGGRLMPQQNSETPKSEGEDTEYKPPKYLNSPQSEFFDKSKLLYGLHQSKPTITTSGEAIVVEGYIDVLRLHQEGFTNAVAPLGTALTAAQVSILTEQLNVNRLYLCFDGDSAGQSASLRATELSLSVGSPWLDIRFIDTDSLDPDDFILQHGAAAFAQRKQDALGLAQFIDKQHTPPQGLRSLEDKAAYLAAMETFISKASGSTRSQLLDIVSSRIDLIPRHALYDGKYKETSDTAHLATEDECVLGRMWVHGQLDKSSVEVFAQNMPQLKRLLAGENPDLARFCELSGLYSEGEIDSALAQINQNQQLLQLENLLNQRRNFPQDRSSTAAIKSMLKLG